METCNECGQEVPTHLELLEDNGQWHRNNWRSLDELKAYPGTRKYFFTRDAKTLVVQFLNEDCVYVYREVKGK